MTHAPGPHSSPGQEPQLGLDKAAAAAVLEAKADEKGAPGKKPVVGTKGKKAVGLTKQKSLVGKRLQLPRNQQLRSLQRGNPPQKRRNLWHKLKCAYSMKFTSLWTANID